VGVDGIETDVIMDESYMYI